MLPRRFGFYDAFGLRIRSELPLPNVAPARKAGAPDVEIRIGQIPAPWQERTGLTVFPSGALLSIPGIARYWIEDGNTVIVEPAASATERNVRLYLMGSAIGAVLHQRGVFPLHANAIAVKGKAIAFTGHSGAGKSTLAAWFAGRGHEILSDDVCAIRSGKPLTVAPGLTRLRLWRDALEAAGGSTSDFDPSFDGEEKYDVPCPTAYSGEPLPLGAVYILKNREQTTGEPVLVQRIAGIDAVNALVTNAYRGAFAKEMGTMSSLMKSCLSISRIPIFEVSRDWGHERMETDGQILSDHAAQVIS